MDIDKGKFWDRAWKLVEGCGHVSAGCDNCWSERETKMRELLTQLRSWMERIEDDGR